MYSRNKIEVKHLGFSFSLNKSVHKQMHCANFSERMQKRRSTFLNLKANGSFCSGSIRTGLGWLMQLWYSLLSVPYDK